MSAPYCLPLNSENASLENVGGKGMSLAKMLNAELPVPDGFHVTTEAYRRFVAANDLQPRILEALRGVSAADTATLDAASSQIGNLFASGAIPAGLASEIKSAYLALSPIPYPFDKGDGGIGEKGISVAVRSSATAEDLPGASFAGQQETYLNIRGADAVLEAVKKCWASLWTARAIAYRLNNAIDQESVALAVVVQKLVFADAAGIMFTANPINGKRDELVINAAWGLGEAIVSGAVTPDTLTVEKVAGRILRQEIAEKAVMTVRTEEGVIEQPVSDAQKRKAVLTDAQAAELARLGIKIEQFYGMPMDVEWAIADGQFAIVQARPITALPEPEAPLPTEWKRTDPKAIYFRSSIVEQLPDPLTPLFTTLGGQIISRGTAKLFNDLLGKNTASEDVFTTVNGYAYYQMHITLRMFWGSLNAVVKFWPEFKRSEQRWREDAHGRYVTVIERWRSRPLSDLKAAELLEGTRQLMAEMVYTYNVLQSGVLGLAGGSEMIYALVYDRLVKRAGDPPAATLVVGFDSLPILAEKSLYDLAQQARACPPLAEYLLRTSAARSAGEIIANQTPPGIEEDAWSAWQRAFAAHLEKYGHTIYNLDFSKPLPADDPAPLLETCKMYLSGQGTSPYDRQQKLVERREQASQAILGRLKGWRLRLFRKVLGWVRTFGPMREDSLADLGLGYPLLRRLLAELGRRLMQAGMLTQPDDVYWLNEDEAERAAAALDRGEPLTSAVALIAQRKAQWRAQKRLTPPTALPERSRMGRTMEKLGPANTAQAAGGVLKGVGASQGQVTGLARVLHGPEDFNQMKPGEILVAAITTPAWTPLFAMASAIVTDVGGVLSHGSIVAREYGIPAVLGTGLATKRIQSGQTITVDGTTGTVTIPKSKDAPIEWKLPKPKGIYMRGSVVDLMPDPLSPLFISMGIPGIITGVGRAGRVLTRSEPTLPSDYFVTINSYAYGGVTFGPREWLWVFGRMLLSYPRILRQGISFWREEVHPHYRAVATRWQAQTPESLTPSELWRGVNESLDAAMYYVGTLMFATMGASAGSEGLLTKVYNRLVKRAGDPPAAALQMGYNTIPIRAEKSLYDLAQWCRTIPALAEHLLNTPASGLVDQLAASSPTGERGTGWDEFVSRFQAYLASYGYIIYQLDFANPLPLETPAPMLENIKMYLRGEGVNPHERQRASEEKRLRTIEMALNRLKGLKRWAFRKALAWAQPLAEVREDALADIGLGYPRLRQMLRELGKRLAQAGALEQADDIFWLEKTEVDRSVAALERGETLASFSAQVQERQAFWQKMKGETAPPMLPPRKTLYGIKTEVFTPATAESQTDGTLKGVAASAGRVTAPARVLRGPGDFGQMRPGEVLVAETTTPAWTPLFVMAAAVVTDVGGPLSHGSIVAREYGIPAVMGTGVGTRRIHNGQMITVDGNNGIVTLGSQTDQSNHE